ncbi:LOW QUALITY PROTEIN: hypothetical protein V2J09_022246 [Rumex salicifolius]
MQEIQPRRRLEFHDPTEFDFDNDRTESLHSKILNDIITRVGMDLETEKATYEFYNAYALVVGFSVRKSDFHRLNRVIEYLFAPVKANENQIKGMMFIKLIDLRRDLVVLAMLKINCRYTSRYNVEKFIAKHNHVDVKNYLHSKRSLEMVFGDTGGVLGFLQSMKEEDPCFFYAIQMLADFENFDDVVCFDTTYHKYKDGRPIALFVGVNHHKQSTIFGAALLYDETTNSFIWLFDTFSRAMGGKLPQTILTDQDAAMAKALVFQWLGTYHRLCIWHIFQNSAIHLKDTSQETSVMLDKYKLQNNNWLERMFNIKEKWALVYGRDTLCADMTTTQRSENMNSLIKKYDRRYDEMVADFKAKQSKVALSFLVEILKHAASVYTPEVYLKFHEELYKAYDCRIELCGETGAFMRYKVTPNRKQWSYENVCYTCKKFEFAGVLCNHILKVFCIRDVKEIHNKYVLQRWTKNAKTGSFGTINDSCSVDKDPKTIMARHHKDLYRVFTRLGTRVVELEDGCILVMQGLLNLLEN